MSKFDNIDFDQPPERSLLPSLQKWDILSILVLVVTACIGLYFLLVFLIPNTPLNPLSPENAARSYTATPSATPRILEPTWTPSATPYIPPTNTALPTYTPVFTPTSVSLVPATKTPQPTATPKSPFSATVEYISSATYHPESGCSALWVAGVVLDKNGAHIYGIQVLLLGTLNGKTITAPMISGQAAQFYGISGFEYQLNSAPMDSRGTLYLQLRDQGGGVQLSENVYINTYADCNKNMVFVRLKKNP
jgi:hypothetical protein